MGMFSIAKPKDGKTTNNEVDENRNIPNIKFNDIGGLADILTKIREIIELPIKAPELFKSWYITT